MMKKRTSGQQEEEGGCPEGPQEETCVHGIGEGPSRGLD